MRFHVADLTKLDLPERNTKENYLNKKLFIYLESNKLAVLVAITNDIIALKSTITFILSLEVVDLFLNMK